MPPSHPIHCVWNYKFDEDFYLTACGNAYCFAYGLKVIKSHQFCPGCGRPIEVEPPPPPPVERDPADNPTPTHA